MDTQPLIPTPCTTPRLRQSKSDTWDYFVSGIIYRTNSQSPFSKTLTFIDGPKSYDEIIKIVKSPFRLHARTQGNINVIITYITQQKL